jgi:acetyl esterase/lipase
MPKSPQLELIVQMLRSRPIDPDATAAELRAGMEQMTQLLSPPPDVRAEGVSVGGRPADWVTIEGATPDRVVLYLHGGGYVIGSPRTHRELAGRIAREAGARVLVIDYRLAPEHPFPAAVDDAVAAYRWLLAQGVSPERIVVAGDSAGGGLALATLLALRDAKLSLPAAGVCISPWVDLAGEGDSMTTKAELDPMVQREPLLRMSAWYRGETDVRHPLVSPLHADLAGLPPLLVHVGSAETLLDDALRLEARARAADVDISCEVWDDMIHVWHAFAPLLPEGAEAVARIGEWIRKRVV